MAATYKLEGHLDSSAAPRIAQELLTHRGAPILIDGGAVASAGTLLLQVLISAKLQWDEDEQSFQTAPISDAMATAAKGLGIPLASFGAASDGEATA
ncbi:STAS domain-containing protein [Gymnodinialimonas ceratoperidinii]|uniref:STAS domain-containing protein n=1 Tax=Gymnodinialimonas ceratoperidinii TaxID=2856823 RepID=A0A8F6YC43_9RHOB|nr:STAS domain-containing protein [Gymnodinialimonas ceratoperidinii]QXT41183.1 STAS domain-containing protein [Gymnodinialimonas ceratoperidinii]